MRQSRDALCLALKARAAVGISGEVIGKDFDRDRAIEASIPCFLDFPHAPGADQTEDFVWPEPRARAQRH